MIIRREILFSAILIFTMSLHLMAQQPADPNDYQALMGIGDYDSALKVLRSQLDTIVSTRVEEKRVPADFISFSAAEDGIDLNRLFNQRKAEHFFIEDNEKLFDIHFNMGRCYLEIGELDAALNHFVQCMRFKEAGAAGDDKIFYQMSRVYARQRNMRARMDMLETAYEIAPENAEYSLELGRALASTNDRKRAIYHLERYLTALGRPPDDPRLYLVIGNLNEDIGRYLNTVDYYMKYLAEKPQDATIYFAVGYLAYEHTGNYALARTSFNRALELLPQNDVFRRSKALEYLGDMALSDMDYAGAAADYTQTINYQQQILDDIHQRISKILEIRRDIVEIKASLLKERDFVKYNEFQARERNRANVEDEKQRQDYVYSKLNPGKVRWNMAVAHERMGQLDKAIEYYREAVRFDYRAVEARQNITKIQLKIERGY